MTDPRERAAYITKTRLKRYAQAKKDDPDGVAQFEKRAKEITKTSDPVFAQPG